MNRLTKGWSRGRTDTAGRSGQTAVKGCSGRVAPARVRIGRERERPATARPGPSERRKRGLRAPTRPCSALPPPRPSGILKPSPSPRHRCGEMSCHRYLIRPRVPRPEWGRHWWVPGAGACGPTADATSVPAPRGTVFPLDIAPFRGCDASSQPSSLLYSRANAKKMMGVGCQWWGRASGPGVWCSLQPGRAGARLVAGRDGRKGER